MTARLPCDRCDTMIDSDTDPHCFIEHPDGSLTDQVICQSCREKDYDREQERLISEPPENYFARSRR